MTAAVEASIVVVGDEILSGHVRDANAGFIAERLAEHGRVLRRVQIVGDDPADISAAVVRDLGDERIGLVFVCGGLGPTHDDRTMEGVSSAVGRPLEPCEPIAARIAAIAEHSAARFSGDVLGIEGLRKMALAPQGSEALECASGVIPAVTLTAGPVRLVVLPGPPRELAMVFRESVEPRFLHGTGTRLERVEVEHLFPESALARVLADAEKAFGGVKIGSYPLGDRVLIRIAGPAREVAAAEGMIRDAIDALSATEDGRAMLEMMRGRHLDG